MLYRILIQMTQDNEQSRATLRGFADCIHSWMAGGQNAVEPAETRANNGLEAVVDAHPTDERIKEIWASFGYRTRFAPHMLRLVRAVLIDVAPLPVRDGRIAQLERLLTRAKNHIVDWWRPEGSLPPAKSPDLVEDIEVALKLKGKS